MASSSAPPPTAPDASAGPGAGPGAPPTASAPGAVPNQIAAGATESSAFAHAPPPPALLPALALFERGDFLAARRELDRLVTSATSTDASPPTSGPPDLVAAARLLRTRLDIDPAAFVVGGVALGLLALVATTYLF